ncbi:MAG: glutaredoxin domain-containing protein [Nanoarchaeota archaeon]
MSEHKVIVYSTPTCPYCKQAKDFLKQHNIHFTEVDVAADEKKAQDMIEKSGQMGVPVVEIDKTIIVGFDKGAMKKALGIS